MMLENCVYDQSELMVLNMVRAGLLGDLTHAEGAYIHNLRWLLDDRNKGEGKWRPHWYTTNKANSYPTHGLGPIAFYFDIKIGRAACRERVCQYVLIWVVAVSL